MLFPEPLYQAILEIIHPLSSKEQKQSAKALSHSYKIHPKTVKYDPLSSKLAYLIVRMPATYAVQVFAISLFLQKVGIPKKIVDLGSGPGTLLWTLQACGIKPEKFTAVEADKEMMQLAQTLYKKLHPQMEVSWHLDTIEKFTPAESYDLAVLSYVLNELTSTKNILEKIESYTTSYILILEPGTPDGYKRILGLRDQALSKGWYILAPCPHGLKCPLEKTKKWCHFYVRLARRKEHKLAKDASLGYEDEKFCYLLLSRKAPSSIKAPILDFPNKSKAGISFPICHPNGNIERIQIPSRNKQAYQASKKLSWGDFYLI